MRTKKAAYIWISDALKVYFKEKNNKICYPVQKLCFLCLFLSFDISQFSVVLLNFEQPFISQTVKTSFKDSTDSQKFQQFVTVLLK